MSLLKINRFAITASVSPLRLALAFAMLAGPGSVTHVRAQAQAPAQENARPLAPGALAAAETLKQQVPDQSFNRLVEISGHGGDPIPTSWSVTALDLRSQTALVEYLVKGRKVEPRGQSDTYYPRVPPEGFFSLARVKVDSEQAFRIADKEAGLAQVGFDTLDFRLRTREFTEDAVWTVRLRNASDEVVGNVDISASTAKILRAVWYYRDPASGSVRILDTAWPNGPKPSTATENAPAPAPAPSANPPAVPSVPPQPLPPPAPVLPGTYEPAPLPPVPSDPGLQPAPEPLPVPPPNPSPKPAPMPVPVPPPGVSPAPAIPSPAPGSSNPSRPGSTTPRPIPR